MSPKKLLPAWKVNPSLSQLPSTPFYLYSENRLCTILNELESAFASFPIEQHHHFAFKSNSNSTLLKLLQRKGFGADVVSGNELLMAISHGYTPQDIVFSGVGKTRRELRLAIEHDICLLNIESEFEFEMLQDLLKHSKKTIRISFRINPNVNAKSHPYISTGLKSHKFGLDLSRAKKLFERAALEPQMQLCGVSVHIGSQLLDLSPLAEALSKTLDFVQTLSQRARKNLSILDVGGGLGVDYQRPDKIPQFAHYAQILRKVAIRWKSQCLLPNPTMVCENGRAIVAQSGLLVTQVIGVKASTPHPFLVIDASMSELMRPSLYQARHEIIELSRSKSKNKKQYTVVGPVCESSDSFGEQFKLSQTLKETSLLGIDSVGAYGATMSHFYNARDLPAEYWLNLKNKIILSRKKLKYFEVFK